MLPKLVVALDTETRLIVPGCLAPDMACTTYAHFNADRKDYASGIIHHTKTLPDLTLWLEGAAYHDDVRLVGHNVAYDMAVIAAHHPQLLPLIFAAYERGNIEDTKLRQQLIDIAEGTFWKYRHSKGGYSLLALVERHIPDFEMSKGEDTYRLRYGELIDKPLVEWPEEALEYAIKDAVGTLFVYQCQQESSISDPETGELTDSAAQARADFCFHLMSCWGVITDAEATKKFIKSNEEIMKCHREKLVRTGLMRVDGTKDLTKIRGRVTSLSTGEIKLTAKGAVSTDSETLLDTGDGDLKLLVEYARAQKLDSVWAKHLLRGANPDTPIQARFHCLVESGRTSCSGPNLQNPHRAAGLRECFVPREGYYYIACDYSTLELCALAQCLLWLFGKSNMALKLQAGVDLHLTLAAQILGVSYDEAVKNLAAGDALTKGTRQMAKAGNFGFAGGMGAVSFASFAKGMGIEITEDEAELLRANWFKMWPEMAAYFSFVNTNVGMDTGTIEHFVSKRKRGGVGFCQAANSFFQGLSADGCKASAFKISQKCYADPTSNLYGSKIIMFIHDELIIEAPIAKASAAGDELAQVMRDVMQQYTPDIPIKTSIAMMDRWYKDAEEVRDVNGKLLCWGSDNGQVGRNSVST